MKMTFLALITLFSFSALAQVKTGQAKEFNSKFGATIGMSRLCNQTELQQLAQAAMNDAVQICKNAGWTFCYKRGSTVVKNEPKYNVHEGTTCEVRSYVDGVFYKPN